MSWWVIYRLRENKSRLQTKKENSKRKVPNQMANQTLKHIKRMDNNCYIPNLMQAFSYEEPRGNTSTIRGKQRNYRNIEVQKNKRLCNIHWNELLDNNCHILNLTPTGLQCSEKFPYQEVSFSWHQINIYTCSVIMNAILNSKLYTRN